MEFVGCTDVSFMVDMATAMMARTTLIYGAVLVLLGTGSFIATKAPTALIPAGFGLILLLLGVMARKESLRGHAMHAAAAVATFGMVATVSAVPKLVHLLAGTPMERPVAIWTQSVISVVCLSYVTLAVRSFIRARRARNEVQ